MTPAELQQLCAEGKRLAERTTPYGSNWRADGADVLSTENYVTARIVDFNRTIAMNSTKEEAECRANFIAFASPSTIFSLIQAIEELSAENERLRKVAEAARKYEGAIRMSDLHGEGFAHRDLMGALAALPPKPAQESGT